MKRALVWGLLGSLVLLAVWFRPDPPSPAEAQGVGIFSRADCTALSSPVSGQTWCASTSSSNMALFVYNGTAFVPVSLTTAAGATVNGPYAIATSVDTNRQLLMGGNYTGTSGFLVAPQIQQSTSTNSTGIFEVGGAVHRFNGAGTTPLVTNLWVDDLIIRGTTGNTITDAVSLYVANAPSQVEGTVTNQRAFYIAGGGNNLIDSDGSFGAELNLNRIGAGPAAQLVLRRSRTIQGGIGMSSTGDLTFLDQSLGNRLMTIGSNAAGGVQVGLATGGDQGTGTISVASGTYTNGFPTLTASPTGVNLMSIRSISATQTKGNNLRGTCTFAASGLCNVGFASNEPDASYFVTTGCPVLVGNKTVSGFTLTATTSNSNACDWMLMH